MKKEKDTAKTTRKEILIEKMPKDFQFLYKLGKKSGIDLWDELKKMDADQPA